jgi:hypothetical protein
VSLDECHGNAQEIEDIGDTMWKATYNEKRDSQKKRKILTLSSELNACGHYEAASDGKKATSERSCTKSQLHNLLGRSLDVHR